jgi:hypothetical protein
LPANLPPQFIETRKRLKEARDPQEKIKIIEELLSIIPKHKATEKIQAELKSKLSKLKKSQDKKPTIGRKADEYFIPKEGAGQIILIGPPNSGKSTLLSTLTNATPEIAPYPYTTRTPLSGMFKFQNISFQLVDIPPIYKEEVKPWMLVLIRNADLVILLLDLSGDPMEQLEVIKERLKVKKIILQIKEEREEDFDFKKTLVLGNKIDLKESRETLEILKEFSYLDFEIIPVSAKERINLENLGEKIYNLLDIIRVYTKAPGKEADLSMPVVLKKKSTIIDVASAIHKDFVQKLRYAKIYNNKRDQSILKVHRDFEVVEGDIVEFHI